VFLTVFSAGYRVGQGAGCAHWHLAHALGHSRPAERGTCARAPLILVLFSLRLYFGPVLTLRACFPGKIVEVSANLWFVAVGAPVRSISMRIALSARQRCPQNILADREQVNCHPHRSDEKNTFVVIHNGIITNCKELKTFLSAKVRSPPALLPAHTHQAFSCAKFTFKAMFVGSGGSLSP
jgi:hypothetical protein